MDDAIFAHNDPYAGVPASQPDDAPRWWLGLARLWTVAEAASRKPYDVGDCKPGTKSAVWDCLVYFINTLRK